jgi:hypothetical protein
MMAKGSIEKKNLVVILQDLGVKTNYLAVNLQSDLAVRW